MNWGAHKADVRIATNNARKIQAALRQGIDAKRVIAAYRKSQPNATKNPTQDRARARAWAMLNMRINNEPLLEVLQKTWADGFVLGQAYGDEAIARAREAKKADSPDYIDWDNWKPGDAATATLLRPPKAFQELLGRARVTIKDLDQTGYDRVGTALADSIEQGLSDTRAARLINDAIGNPARALSIAITETNRAMSQGAISRYQAAKLEQMEWATSDPCVTCKQNSGQVIEIGGTFNSGAQMPPAHPHCRCALLPVIPEFEANEQGVVLVEPPKPAEDLIGGVSERELISFSEAWANRKTKKYRMGLDAAYDVKGYNGKPRLLSGAEFDTAAELADVRVYRGMAGKGNAVDKYVKAYQTGDHYAGLGIHGNGTYTSNNLATAKSYARTKIDIYSKVPNTGALMDMAIPNLDNFIDVDDFKKIHNDFIDAVNARRKLFSNQRFEANLAGDTALVDKLTAQMDQIDKIDSVILEPGTAATLLGYDGLIVDVGTTNNGIPEKMYIILNRAKVIVKKEFTKS